MPNQQQNYANHRRWVPAYHFLLSLLILATLIGSIVNLVESVGTEGLYSASLIVAISVALILLFYFTRAFPLRAQDRVILLEENFRRYLKNGELLDPRLNVRQVVGLRFASDDEIEGLIEKAIGDNLSEADIKKAIASWQADDYRV